MLVPIITLLIYVCVFALVLYLVFWVLEMIGVPLPPMVVRIIWIIFALVVLLWVVQALPSLHLPALR